SGAAPMSQLFLDSSSSPLAAKRFTHSVPTVSTTPNKRALASTNQTSENFLSQLSRCPEPTERIYTANETYKTHRRKYLNCPQESKLLFLSTTLSPYVIV